MGLHHKDVLREILGLSRKKPALGGFCQPVESRFCGACLRPSVGDASLAGSNEPCLNAILVAYVFSAGPSG